jgi:hypothetical protein
VGNDEWVGLVIAKAGVLRADGNMLSEDAARQIAQQLAERFPGRVEYHPVSQEVVLYCSRRDLDGAILPGGEGEARSSVLTPWSTPTLCDQPDEIGSD